MTSRLVHISHQTTLPTTQKYGGGTVNHVVSAGYDVNTGLIVHFTDQNNQTTYYGYDYARRPTSFTYPDGGQRSVTYNDSTPNPSLTVSTLISSTIGSTSRKVTFDGVRSEEHTADLQSLRHL